ncbi:MAG: hypothetical protein K2J20_03195 [Bacilli bacterium]|nr:hypothetical protein [Bacilli bacterium]
MTKIHVYQEVSDQDWMKGVLLQASDSYHIGEFDKANTLLDIILDKLGISFHSRIADKSEIAMRGMIAEIESAFREFDSFTDERYIEYLNNQLGRTKVKLCDAKNGLFTSEKLMELMLMLDILNSSVEELKCPASRINS